MLIFFRTNSDFFYFCRFLPNFQLEHRLADSDVQPALRHLPFYWAFQSSVLQHCLRHFPMFGFLRQLVPDPVQLHHSFCSALLKFLSLVLAPPLGSQKPKGFAVARRVIVEGMLETSQVS